MPKKFQNSSAIIKQNVKSKSFRTQPSSKQNVNPKVSELSDIIKNKTQKSKKKVSEPLRDTSSKQKT